MQFSYSRVECHESCPYKFKLRYLDKFDVIASDDPANALILGTALHTGLEKGATAAIDQYTKSYPIITDEHINEIIKLEYLIPEAARMLPDDGQFETAVSNPDFIGYIDFLTTEDGVNYDMYDFKYSNHADRYRKSGQMHVYKYFWEQANPDKKINSMFFLMIPKVGIKKGKKEDLTQFRRRIQAELSKIEPFLVPVEYDPRKVVEFMFGIKYALEDTEYPKNTGYLCNWCDYQPYCERNETYMLLPKNERRNIEVTQKRTIWLYGSPFSGKTTFANKFPNVLMLNTDGNITFVDAPYIAIKNIVKVEGRITKTTLAWEIFKDAITELEKKDNEFETIVVDLLEDLYEHCRLYMYKQLGITHESDDSFKAWDKVRTEFLSTLKRLMNLDYENIILISHEDTTKDITRKSGDKITAIKPNLQEKASNKVAGMVQIVARVVADGDARTLSFKTDEVIFGGGRLSVTNSEIPLDYNEFIKIYEEAAKNAASTARGSASQSDAATKTPEITQDKPKRKGRETTPSTDDKPQETKDAALQGKENEPPTPGDEDAPPEQTGNGKAGILSDEFDVFFPQKKQRKEAGEGGASQSPDESNTDETKPAARTRKRRSE